MNETAGRGQPGSGPPRPGAMIGGRRVAGIGLGTAPLAFGDGTAEDAVATVRAALDAGVGLIDTALAYTRAGIESYAEQVVAYALRGSTGERPPTAQACARRGLAYLAYAPLSAPSGPPLRAALRVARRRQASVQRVVLAWLREQAPNIVPLVGASRPASIRDSADLLALTPDDLTDLGAARQRNIAPEQHAEEANIPEDEDR